MPVNQVYIDLLLWKPLNGIENEIQNRRVKNPELKNPSYQKPELRPDVTSPRKNITRVSFVYDTNLSYFQGA